MQDKLASQKTNNDNAHNYQRENEAKAVNDDQHDHQAMRDVQKAKWFISSKS